MKWSGSNQATKRSAPAWSTRRKRRKACILWRSRRTAFAIIATRCDERIAMHLQQLALAMEDAPYQAIEQRVALWIAMADDELDKVGDGARQSDGGASPDVARPRRRDRASRQCSRLRPAAARCATSRRSGRAKPGKVGALRQIDAMHGPSEQAHLLGRRDEASAQVEPIRQTAPGDGPA